MIVPVFKTGGRQVFLSPVGSTPTRFRHLFSLTYISNDKTDRYALIASGDLLGAL